MTMNKVRRFLQLAAVSLAAPSLCLPAAVSINGVCKLGNCANHAALQPGQSSAGTFSFIYTFPNSDAFKVVGLYSAANSSSTGISYITTARALYIGTTPSAGDDLLTIDVLEGFKALILDGTYSYSDTLFIGPLPAPSSYVETNLYYDGQDVGPIGPLAGPGIFYGSASADLTGITNPIAADWQYTFYFAAGSLGVTSSDADPDGPDPNAMGVTGSASVVTSAIRN